MKKILFVAAVCITLSCVSCTNGNKGDTVTKNDSTKIDTTLVDTIGIQSDSIVVEDSI